VRSGGSGGGGAPAPAGEEALGEAAGSHGDWRVRVWPSGGCRGWAAGGRMGPEVMLRES
jgi:hypothetical protein